MRWRTHGPTFSGHTVAAPANASETWRTPSPREASSDGNSTQSNRHKHEQPFSPFTSATTRSCHLPDGTNSTTFPGRFSASKRRGNGLNFYTQAALVTVILSKVGKIIWWDIQIFPDKKHSMTYADCLLSASFLLTILEFSDFSGCQICQRRWQPWSMITVMASHQQWIQATPTATKSITKSSNYKWKW